MAAKMIPNKLSMNFNTPAGRRELMKLYGESTFPYVGTNADGEEVKVSITKTSIVVQTYQSNGWVRVNYYDEEGLAAGETFDGKWR